MVPPALADHDLFGNPVSFLLPLECGDQCQTKGYGTTGRGARNQLAVGDGSRFQQLTTMPGIRWWKQQANVHYFASLYAVAARYHIGGWFGHDYRYDGTAYGPGIGVGYSYVLNRHWNIEAEIGAGYLYTDYDKCGWKKNSHLYAHESGWKLLPTKFDVSFVYFF